MKTRTEEAVVYAIIFLCVIGEGIIDKFVG
jgi:hypothetical protein